MRTSGPSLPSGRSAASTGHSAGSPDGVEHTRARPAASRDAGGQRLGLVDPVDRLGHVDDVDVAHVVELAAAALAHADDREPDTETVVVEVGPGQRQRRLQRGTRQVRQRRRDPGQAAQRVGAGEVGRRDAQQARPVRQPHRVRPRGTDERRHRDVRVGVGTDRAQELGPDLGHGDARPRRVVEEHPQRLRVRDERVPQRHGRADDGEQPRARRTVLLEDAPQHPHQLGVPDDRPGELRQRQQRLVRVRDVRERRDQHVRGRLDHLQQRRVREQPLGAAGVGHADPGEPTGQRRPAPGRGRAHAHSTGRNRRSSYGVTCER